MGLYPQLVQLLDKIILNAKTQEHEDPTAELIELLEIHGAQLAYGKVTPLYPQGDGRFLDDAYAAHLEDSFHSEMGKYLPSMKPVSKILYF